MTLIAIFALVLLAYGLYSKRLESSILTGPMAVVTAGLLAGALIAGPEYAIELEIFLLLGEIALVLTLFHDAARMDLRTLRENRDLPARLLAVGMPLTIIAGTAASLGLLAEIPFWEAAVLATVLAPTDAGLGQAVVNNPSVPSRIRQALNVEAGLNDGISIPFLAIFGALALAEEGAIGAGAWAAFAAQQIGFALLAGILVGLIGGRLLRHSQEQGWMTPAYHRLIMPALAVLAWGGAGLIGGNGFIAAFAAGLTARQQLGEEGEEAAAGFIEAEGQLLAVVVFFFFAVLAAPWLRLITPEMWVYAALSLTVVRMLPVAISMLGVGLDTSSVAFLGWFGPRGLASIVLGLLVIEQELELHALDAILPTVIATVLLSVYAHGATAAPLTEWYSKRVEQLPPDAPEHQEVVEMPVRMRESAAG